MKLSRTLKTNFQHPLVIASLAILAVHFVISAAFYMDGAILERQAWATLAVLGLGFVAVEYRRFSDAFRGFALAAIGVVSAIAGLGIHVSHVVQGGFSTSDYTGIPMTIAALFLALLGVTILVRLVHTWWRRLLLVPPGIVFAFFVVFPVGFGVFATHVAHMPCCDETPADYGLAYEDVTFETAGGVELSAWFVPSENGATIITVHGAGNNRATVLPEATMLARHGYGLLMVDLEGYGDSEGRSNALGWVGARDVHAAVGYLKGRSDVDPERLGGLGLSMGGEVLLQASGESDALKAVVAEGATGRTGQDIRAMDGFGYDTAVSAFHNVAGFTISLISGEPAPPPLKQMVQQIAPNHVLLIAASLPEEEKIMGLYRDIGGPTFEMWTIPESKHVGAYDLHRQEYEQRVTGFFDSVLLGSAGPVPEDMR